MSNHQEKHSGAMRIFEALSSVDEELLERCNEKAKVIPFWKYTKVMAACACLLLVCLVTWTGTQVFKGNNSTSSDCAAPESMNEMAVADAIAADTEGGGAEEADPEYDMAGDANTPAEAEEQSELEVKEESSKVTQDSATDSLAEAENQHGIVWDSGSSIAQLQESLGEEELRAVKGLGEYIPTVIPEGYVFESGYRMAEGGLHLCWSKGMDTIMISVSVYEANEENEGRIVDISKPETYDEHRYEIPYASTVPEEYRQVFQNPIFRESDFTPEAVSARMKSVADMGDTDTPRGNFAVLYDSGVIVSFNGDGDAEQIWEMFESVGEK